MQKCANCYFRTRAEGRSERERAGIRTRMHVDGRGRPAGGACEAPFSSLAKRRMPPLSSAAGQLSHFRRGASDPRIAPSQGADRKTEGDDGFRVRHVSRVSAARRDERRAGVRDLVRAGRRGRALGPRRDVAGRNPYRAGALGAVGAADPRQRDRRPHQADEDRHRASRYCRCAIRCASPRRSRRSIRSAMAG